MYVSLVVSHYRKVKRFGYMKAINDHSQDEEYNECRDSQLKR